jgi:hypothetical protein
MSKVIVTSGSGPSYSKWPYWPIWTKMLPMMYSCKCIDISGPAAGNKFINRAVITQIDKLSATPPDLVLVQWNLGKFDIYVENKEFIDQILNGKSIRNFLVDIHTGKTATESGYWCSSYDNTVAWKRYYNENIETRTGTAIDDLEAMLNLQNYCKTRSIPYKFFTHDDIDHEFLSNNKNTKPFYNAVDWDLQVFPSVRTMFQQHTESYQYDTSGTLPELQWTPNADFQYFFLENYISKLFSEIEMPKKQCNRLKEYCHKKTLEFYEKSKKLQ